MQGYTVSFIHDNFCMSGVMFDVILIMVLSPSLKHEVTAYAQVKNKVLQQKQTTTKLVA